MNRIKKIFNGLKSKKAITMLLVLVSSVFVFVVGAKPAAAFDPIGGAITLILQVIALAITSVVGVILTLMIKILVNIAQFNNIINVPTVVNGWIIIRDICNMFFILILLVIAFATILRVDTYNWKKMLPKLLIMAVLINFSRTIFGLIIDASQVFMLTFVNAFKDSGGGYFIEMFQTKTWFSVQSEKELSMTAVAGSIFGDLGFMAAIIAGVLASVITLIVVVVMLATLVMRIIMLWIYTILSPLVFMGFAFPPLQKYTAQIWEDFIKQIIVGPVLAFFLWLAMTSAVPSSDILTAAKTDRGIIGNTTQEVCVGTSKFFCEDNFQRFIVVIGLLMGGLMVAQKMGGAAGAIAGKGMQWAKQAGGLVGKGAYKAPLKAGSWLGLKVKTGAVSSMFGTFDPKTSKWTGRLGGEKTIRGKALGKIASGLEGLELRPTKIIAGAKLALKDLRQEDETLGTTKSAKGLKKGGISGLIKGLGVSQDLTNALAGPGGFMMWKGFRRAGRVMRSKPEELAKMDDDIKAYKAGMGSTAGEIARQEGKATKTESRIRDERAKGTAANPDLINKLNAQLLVEREQLRLMRLKPVSDDEKKEQIRHLNELERKKTEHLPIQTFYADREREELVRKEMSKLGNKDNEAELVDMFRNAVASDDKTAAAAVILQAAKVGHLNEIIHSQTSEEDVYDETGKLLIREGEILRQGQDGLNALVNQVLIKHLGMDQQQAYGIQSDASSFAKTVGHYNLSESVGTKNGFLVQRTSSEQRSHARGELRKVDVEKALRNYNRLSWGDEVYEDGERTFKLNELGMDNFIEWADSIATEINRGRFQKNAAMNIASDGETLLKYVRALKDRGIVETTKLEIEYNPDGTEKSRKTVVINYEELARRLIEYGQRTAEMQKDAAVRGGVDEAKAAAMSS